MVQLLPSQFEVCGGATGLEIVHHNGPAVAGRFRETDVAGNHGVELLPRKVSVDLIADQEGEARTAVEHREQDPEEVETRIQLLSNKLHGLLEQMGQSLERVELALERDEHSVRGVFSSRRRHTRLQGDWSSDVCSSD